MFGNEKILWLKDAYVLLIADNFGRTADLRSNPYYTVFLEPRPRWET